MATRNLIMVVDRKHSSRYPEGFAIHPDLVNEHSYVNMYMHHDGYPEWQGVQIANWLHTNARQDAAAMAAKFVHDHYYDSAYLYADAGHIDHQYTYVIWTGDKDDMWVSCYDQYNSSCVFVLKPEKIISKYMSQDEPMNYTDFANDETRFNQADKEDGLYHARKLVDLFTK